MRASFFLTLLFAVPTLIVLNAPDSKYYNAAAIWYIMAFLAVFIYRNRHNHKVRYWVELLLY